jgi:hypothetical protein
VAIKTTVDCRIFRLLLERQMSVQARHGPQN